MAELVSILDFLGIFIHTGLKYGLKNMCVPWPYMLSLCSLKISLWDKGFVEKIGTKYTRHVQKMPSEMNE